MDDKGNLLRDEGDNHRLKLFIALFSEHQRKLHLYITGLVFNPADAYDILQDTNLALWEHFDSFELGTNFLAWARKIAFHRVLRFRQSRNRGANCVDPHILESLATKSSEQSQDLLDARQDALQICLEKLKTHDRVLVEQRYKSTLSVKGIAEKLGRSENGISQSLRRIRSLLKTCITSSLGNSHGHPLT